MSAPLTRRSVLLGSTAMLLVQCSAAQVAAWLSAEQAVGQEFTVVAPELAGLGVDVKASVVLAGQTVAVNGTTVTVDGQTFTLEDVGALVENMTNALGTASTVSEGQSTLVKIEAYVNAIVPTIWPVVGPLVTAADPGVGLTLGLIVKALPAIEGMLNFAVAFTKNFLSANAQALAALAPPAPASLRLRLHPITGAALTPSEQALAQLMQRAGR